MSSRKSMQRQVMYNRQSKAWQQNQMKNRMAEAGYAKGAPKSMDAKKLKIGVIAAAVVWLIVTVLLIIKLHWWGLLIGAVVGLAATGIFILYLRKKEEEIMRYYKSMGIPKQEFFKQMRRTTKNIDQKQMKKMGKTWDRVKVK